VLDADTIRELDAILPIYWSKGNPIDMLGEATPELYRKVLEICLEANEIDGVLILSVPQALTNTAEVAEELIGIIKKAAIPIITAWVGGAEMQKGRDIFNQAGVPTFDTPERAVRAFIDIYKFYKNIEMSKEIPARFPKAIRFDHKKAADIVQTCLQNKNRMMTEQEAKELLCAYGIPVNPIQCAANKEEAFDKANALGFPVALKINSRDITHKSDANGVQLNLKTKEDVYNAFERVIINAHAFKSEAKIDGVSIQPMRKQPTYELIVGAKRDRDFGPVILFGMGGILAEIINDRAISLPPLNRLLARRLMEQTNVYRLLKGYRNIEPANIALLEEILIRVSQLVTDFPEIEELDINPLFVDEKSACAIDARVLLNPSDIPSPLHMVISSYPNQYEEYIHLENVGRIFIRAIRPEDAPLLMELFRSLSERSIYNRFFSPLKELPHDMIARFTQIDYDREIALVAVLECEEQEKMLGVGRVIIANDQKNAEFAVMVGDQWHGKGIGAELLKRCLSISKARHIERVFGLVLADNTNMLALGRKLGFSMTRIPGTGTYELSFQFAANHMKADEFRLSA
jgi:acetyltransferase